MSILRQVLALTWVMAMGLVLAPVPAAEAAPAVLLNELVASNSHGAQDPQGQYEDWIEVYNAGTTVVDLAGLYLTDDWDKPTKWRIPGDRMAFTIIPPHGYLLVWADDDTAAIGLHAAFRLSSSGGQLALFDTDGQTLIDSVAFSVQYPNVSYGRDPTAGNVWRYFAVPTPGGPNAGAYLGVVADLKFTPERGFYSAPRTVEIATKTAGASIYYTVDGSSPYDLQHGVATGRPYAGPISITTTTCLRAIAVKAGWRPSKIDTHTYLYLDDVIRQATDPVTGAQVVPSGDPTIWPGGSFSGAVTGDYQMDPDVVGQNGQDKFGGLYAKTIKSDLQAAPMFSLVMNRDDWFGSKGIYINQYPLGAERAASIEFLDPATNRVAQLNCAIAIQGGVSGGGTSLDRWKDMKLSMRPRFKPQLDDGTPTGGPSQLDFNLFLDSPVQQINTFVFDGVLNHSWLHATDASQRNTALYFQDQYVADLHNAMGGWSPHGFHAHVYLNGLYWGMYYIHERPDHAWAAQIFGGEPEEYDALKHSSSGVVNSGYGGNATTNFNTMLSAANAVSADPTSLVKYQALCNLLDVDEFIRYLLANWYTGNQDWPAKNWYATHRNTPDGRWRFHSWDAEHTLEGDTPVGQSPVSLHSKLANNPEYQMRFADLTRRYLFHNGPLTTANATALFKARMSTVDRAIVGESARWGDNRRALPYTRQDWLNTVNSKLNSFFPTRTSMVLNALKSARLYPSVDAPEFSIDGQLQHGGHVATGAALSLTGGTIYFTLDGTDPRLPGRTGQATISPTAIPYTRWITLTKSTLVKARVLSGTTWSALNEATFAVGPVAQSLRVSELMYHPRDTGNPNDPNTEFIELTNIANQSINLNLVRFTQGLDYTFPSFDLAPGGYCLVVKDLAAFQAKYGPRPGLIGPYSGSLSNSGERVELVDAVGTTIESFTYADNWYKSTDGSGYSLTVQDPGTTDPNSLSNKNAWRASAAVDGSPGSSDTGQ